jgi:hypothetical protein
LWNVVSQTGRNVQKRDETPNENEKTGSGKEPVVAFETAGN